MFLDGVKLYQVLDRCEDLFPEWQREGNSFWNSQTGEIIHESGLKTQDLVYRGFNYSQMEFNF